MKKGNEKNQFNHDHALSAPSGVFKALRACCYAYNNVKEERLMTKKGSPEYPLST